jgi:hypothetical protein
MNFTAEDQARDLEPDSAVRVAALVTRLPGRILVSGLMNWASFLGNEFAKKCWAVPWRKDVRRHSLS